MWDFLEERAGLRTLWRKALDEPIPGGPRWAYVFGSVLLLLLGLQLLTGFVLALYYAPSVSTAWASIVYFEERIRGGKLVRGLHAWGASAIVLALAAHYVQVLWAGAYKKPRELNWVLGILLALVVLGFALTGYLLPWDQKGYWATRVATSIAGATPGVGGSVQRLAQGGEDQGNLTLTRFYAIHAVLLPAILVALVAAHLALFRRHGVTARAETPVGRFYPGQALRDVVAFVLAFGLLAAFVLHRGGAPLDAPADPSSDYEPRPEWYFLPLFELLKYFPASLEFVGSEVIPGLVLALLLALPWLDRSETRAPRARARAIAIGLAPLVAAAALGSLAAVKDANQERAARLEEAEADARLARRLFIENGGVPPEGPLALLDRHPPRLGARVFKEKCASCHSIDGRPAPKGPDLTGYLSRRWLEDVIRDPTVPRFFGTPGFKEGMGATEATPAELAALAAYVQALEDPGKPLSPPAERGRALYEEKECASCHATKPEATGEGPNLAGYGSEEWLRAFILAPASKRFYGKRNKMPAFEGKLAKEELDAVVLFLRNLRGG